MFNLNSRVPNGIGQSIALLRRLPRRIRLTRKLHTNPNSTPTRTDTKNALVVEEYDKTTKQTQQHEENIEKSFLGGRKIFAKGRIRLNPNNLVDIKKLDEVCDHLEDRRERVDLSYSELLNLMKVCHKYKTPLTVKRTLALYYNCMAHYMEIFKNERITLEEHDDIVFYLLASFQNCDEITDLLTLRIFWDSMISHNINNKKLRYLYISAFIHTFLNTGQNQKAIETFERGYQDLLTYHEQNSELGVDANAFQLFPIIRLLDIMCSNRDCNGLLKWLAILADMGNDNHLSERQLKDIHWLKYLNLALTENDYQLVKCIYDRFIMRDFQNGVSSEDILFRERRSLFLSDSINSLNDDTFYRILHTFSISGDVNLVLSLIETQFFHKTLQGQKALTKDLCVKIIEAYCYHKSAESFENDSDPTDESMCRVLDVANTFVVRFEGNGSNQITYKDMTEAFSYKFMNYRLKGDNTNYNNFSKTELMEGMKDGVDMSKFNNELGTNFEISTSGMGNVLANFNVLSTFIESHILYMKAKNFHHKTFTLFLNCVLNHTNLYQNFTGTIKVLSILSKFSSRVTEEWLDELLYDIIMNSLSNSNSGKICSHLLFNFLKENKILSRDHFRCLISANLRGSIHKGSQFFLYQYYLHFGGCLDKKILSLLLDIPKNIVDEDASTSKLLSMIFAGLDRNMDRSKIEEFWKANNCCKEAPQYEDHKSSLNNRHYHHTIDVRDAKILAYLLNVSMPNVYSI